MRFRVPAKVVISGSFVVLDGEACRVVALNTYMNVQAGVVLSPCPMVVVTGEESMTCRLSGDSEWRGSEYLFAVVESFFRVTGLVPRNEIYIDMRADCGFFTDAGEKTGIGSSACMFVAVVYSLLRLHQGESRDRKWSGFPVFAQDPGQWLDIDISDDVAGDLVPVMYLTHQMVHRRASGCDVMCCLLGSIQFSRTACAPLDGIPKHLILGSFGKSTSTRDMVASIDLGNPRWSRLREINSAINSGAIASKEGYRLYLDAMRAVSTAIVPDEQYSILVETNRYAIWGCGVSGAGGNDCVWAVADDLSEVQTYWERVFSFTFVAEIEHRGLNGMFN